MNAATLKLGDGDQFRLTRLQTFNWGTFSGLLDIAIPHTGFLFVGPSGSGKSTLLDAHTALLTPPKWIDFNVAAREAERSGKDRNALSYVRGAWARQTSDAGEHTTQFLRLGTTWSAIAETYRDQSGRTVLLAQVLWMRGNSTSHTDVKRLFCVLQRDLSLRELEFFGAHDFDVRRFKQTLPDAFVRDEFGPYQERFRSLLGIDNERALRLLHKTQSAKNLGDINVFLRDFMLDAPETFKIADRLVSEFGELSAAHQAVVSARRQIETLVPAREGHDALQDTQTQRQLLDSLAAAVTAYREQRKQGLLTRRIEELAIETEGARLGAEQLRSQVNSTWLQLCELRNQRHGMGGGLLEQLQQQRDQAQSERPQRVHKRNLLLDACRTLTWDIPETAPAFVRCVASAKERMLGEDTRAAELEAQKDAVKEQKRDKESAFIRVREEIHAMERQPSNIPARMLAVRANMARALGIDEQVLPFAGELLQVKKSESAWQGAIERVLHSFAQSLIVDDRYYSMVSSYLNEQSVGERVVYLRTVQHTDERRSPGVHSLVRKLDFAPGNHSEWLRSELNARFDYECTDSIATFRKAQRAVTREGQVKHGLHRHEKDDRRRVDDRSRWVLGFDNKDKLALYKNTAAELAGELASLQAELERLGAAAAHEREQLRACQTVSNLTWPEVDVASVIAQIENLRARIDAETRARPELRELDAQIAQQEQVHARTEKERSSAEVKVQALTEQTVKLTRALAALHLELLALSLTSHQHEQLEARFAELGRTVTLENISELTHVVDRGISDDAKELAVRAAELKHAIERKLAEFNRNWPAESDGLDPTLSSAPDYLSKLTRLESDGLPRYEERFMKLLHEQSDQNLTLLVTRLDQERAAIRSRLELVNDSLREADFNPGTHLVIEPQDRLNEDVRQFKLSVKQALSHSFSSDSERAEQRFEILRALVTRLASAETVDRNWRSLVLDVRQHVEFIARELDEDACEVEVYTSGAGKSGGQRQKLAATCLAAALRYQLGGQDRSLPCFAAVALDEAFDKADAEFTTMAMNIFKNFGFQMLVATPLKSVMTLEPFIGGACFVHIKDRKSSSVVHIEYDEVSQRLKLPDNPHSAQLSQAAHETAIS